MVIILVTLLKYFSSYNYIDLYSYVKNLDFINIKKLITFGNISYSFYLWHLVIFFAELYIINIYNIHIFFSIFNTTLFYLYLPINILNKNLDMKKNFSKNFQKKLDNFFYFLIMLLGYVKYFNDDIRYKVRNFINI